jgi:hypothetical protein
MIAQAVNFVPEGFRSAAAVGLEEHAARYLRYVEIAAGQFAPMSARKHPNALKIGLADLGPEPFGSFGKFSPKRTVADKQ